MIIPARGGSSTRSGALRSEHEPRRNRVGTGWRTFLKKLQPFSSDRKLEIGEARDIPLWPGQVRNESRSDRISNARKNDR